MNRASDTSWTLRGHFDVTHSPPYPLWSVHVHFAQRTATARSAAVGGPRCHPLPLAKFPVVVAEEVCTESPWTFIGHAPAA